MPTVVLRRPARPQHTPALEAGDRQNGQRLFGKRRRLANRCSTTSWGRRRAHQRATGGSPSAATFAVPLVAGSLGEGSALGDRPTTAARLQPWPGPQRKLCQVGFRCDEIRSPRRRRPPEAEGPAAPEAGRRRTSGLPPAALALHLREGRAPGRDSYRSRGVNGPVTHLVHISSGTIGHSEGVGTARRVLFAGTFFRLVPPPDPAAPVRQAGGHWFEPSNAHRETPGNMALLALHGPGLLRHQVHPRTLRDVAGRTRTLRETLREPLPFPLQPLRSAGPIHVREGSSPQVAGPASNSGPRRGTGDSRRATRTNEPAGERRLSASYSPGPRFGSWRAHSGSGPGTESA